MHFCVNDGNIIPLSFAFSRYIAMEIFLFVSSFFWNLFIFISINMESPRSVEESP